MGNKAPINDLNDIAKRKQQLKARIEQQERKLSKDLDAYQDDIETLKKTWNGLKSVRKAGESFSLSGVGSMLRALPIGKSFSGTAGKSKWLTAFTVGAEVVSWIIKRRSNKKSSKK